MLNKKSDGGKVMYRVALRYKIKADGKKKSIYLQFNPPIKDVRGKETQYEFLNLDIYVNPANTAQKKYNQTVEEVAENIKCERYIQLVRRDFSFLAKDNLDGDFLEYFHENGDYHSQKYICARLHFEEFCEKKCSFRDLSFSLCEKYRLYILRDKHLTSSKKISHNTASAYFNVFLKMVRLAFEDKIISHDYTEIIQPIVWNHDILKEYLSNDEVDILRQTPYPPYPELPKACLFSIFTGLRRSDILALRWENIVKRAHKTFIEIQCSKTGVLIQLPLSKPALDVLGKRKEEGTVFQSLTISILNLHVQKWLDSAGIIKHITFHCFRHTFAMLLQEKGVEIYTISKLLAHKRVSSTQVYAKVTNQQVYEAIQLLK